MKIAYVTDTGTGKNIHYFLQDNIDCLPLQISVNSESLQDMEEMNHEQLLLALRQQKKMATSLPSLGRIQQLFEHYKQTGVQLIFAVPICRGLSGTMDAMQTIAQQLEIPILCIDTNVTAIVQEYLIRLAKQMFEQGKTQQVVLTTCQQVIQSTNTLILPNDLQHLKRGGRLTPVAAALAGLLKIKPILQINQKTQGKIDLLEKVRTYPRALERAIELMKQDCINETTLITIAHVDCKGTAIQLEEKLRITFPQAEIQIIPLVNVVSIHIGLDSLAIQYFNRI